MGIDEMIDELITTESRCQKCWRQPISCRIGTEFRFGVCSGCYVKFLAKRISANKFMKIVSCPTCGGCGYMEC